MKKTAGATVLVLTVFCLFGCKSTAQATVPAKQAAVDKIDSKALAVEVAPWVEGELLGLKITSLLGQELGIISYCAERGGKDIWRIISYNYLSSSDSPQYTVVAAQEENFRPVFTQMVNLLGEIRATYVGGKVKLNIDGATGKIEHSVDVTGAVYDNEQLVYLLRRLPLKEDYKVSFRLFTVLSEKLVDCDIAVVGKEQVEVGAGKFDCYRVNLTLRADGSEPQEQAMWFSADEHRYLTKYIAGMSLIMELAEIGHAEKDVPLVFEDSSLGCGLAVPYDWRFYKHAVGTSYFVELLASQLKAKAALVIMPASGGNAYATARTDAETFKNMLKDYTVRGNEFREVSVGGVKAVQYTADFIEESNAVRQYSEPKEMVEYRTYIVGNEKTYLFVFRAEKDKFDNLKSEFDAIIQSFELKK